MRIFLDTNILVSALVARGLCWDLLNGAAVGYTCDLLVSGAVLTELTQVLTDKFKIPYEKTMQALVEIRQLVEVVPEGEPLTTPIPDPDDVPILASALAAGADLFVTGDKALLGLGSIGSTAIVSPRECWLRLRESG